MPTAEFFEQFGLFAVREFLEPDFCFNLCLKMKKAPSKMGTFVSSDSREEILNEEIKKRLEVTKISHEFSEIINKKLSGIKSKIADHYKLELVGFQPPKFSIYRKGDFYKPHVDSNIREEAADFLKERKVSTIIFLNEESAFGKENCYTGGNLTFHGLIKNDTFGKFGFPLISEPGMLITFLPDLIHEVTPVTAGERFAVTTWFV